MVFGFIPFRGASFSEDIRFSNAQVVEFHWRFPLGGPSFGFKSFIARLNGVALGIFKTEFSALNSRLRSRLLGAAVIGMRFAGLFVALSIDLEKCQVCEIILDGLFPQGVTFVFAFASRIARLDPDVLAFVPASVVCKEARFAPIACHVAQVEAGKRFAERIGAAFWQVHSFGEAFFVGYELVFVRRIGGLVAGVCFTRCFVSAFPCVPQSSAELLAFFCLIRINRGLAVSHSSVILNDYGRGCLVLFLLFLAPFALPRAQNEFDPGNGRACLRIDLRDFDARWLFLDRDACAYDFVGVVFPCQRYVVVLRFGSISFGREGFDYDVFRGA